MAVRQANREAGWRGPLLLPHRPSGRSCAAQPAQLVDSIVTSVPSLPQLRAVLTAVQPVELVVPRGEMSRESLKVGAGEAVYWPSRALGGV